MGQTLRVYNFWQIYRLCKLCVSVFFAESSDRTNAGDVLRWSVFFGPGFWGHTSCPWLLIPSGFICCGLQQACREGTHSQAMSMQQESGVVQGPRRRWRRRKWRRWRKRIWGTVHLQQADWSSKVEQSTSCHTRFVFIAQGFLLGQGVRSSVCHHPMASCSVPKSLGSKA